VTYQIEYSDIMELDIADGLKKLLVDNGFTQHKIQKSQTGELASILGIEEYVAKIICNAARRKSLSLLP
jgi:predicted membrane GTPase involved in stress response